MSTIKLENKGQVQMVAHRGLSGLETENTHAAFVAAGNRSHFGIETDVHKTADGHYVVIHDDSTARVAGDNLLVEQSTFADLRALLLKQKDGNKGRTDIRIPTLEEYIAICKHYDKTAVLEFKNEFSETDIAEVVGRIDALGWLDRTVFISFWYENLQRLRTLLPDQPAQFLTAERDDHEWLCGELAANRFDIDIHWPAVTKERIAMWHAAGLKVNCWTVDDPAVAERLIAMGVDMITSNILE